LVSTGEEFAKVAFFDFDVRIHILPERGKAFFAVAVAAEVLRQISLRVF
jgi:hypothetical protein